MRPEWDRPFCVQNEPEYSYKKCLWVWIIVHLAAYLACYILDEIFDNKFLSASYREITQANKDYSSHYRWFTFTAFSVFAGASGFSYWISTLVNFDDGDSCESSRRGSYSIILLWMWTDALISFLSIVCVFLDYHLGMMQHIYQMREYIALAKRNAVKKFYSENKKVEDLDLSSKLADNILRRKDLYQEVVDPPTKYMASEKSPEELEKSEKAWNEYRNYRQAERRALNHLPVKLEAVIGNIKHAKWLLIRNEDPDFKRIRGVETTDNLKKMDTTKVLDDDEVDQGLDNYMGEVPVERQDDTKKEDNEELDARQAELRK